MIQLRVDGHWLSEIGPWAPPTYATVADGGSDTCEWKMVLPPAFSSSSLRRGRVVEVMLGPIPIWAGLLAQPEYAGDDEGWSFHADGHHVSASGFACLTSGGATTSTPDTAIDTAIADGIGWTRPVSISSASFADQDETASINKLSDLLDAYALSASQRWGVDPYGRVYIAADPTEPDYILVPGAVTRYGLADDEYASGIVLSYLSSTTFLPAVVKVSDQAAADRWGPRWHPVDATEYGPMTLSQATDVANGLIADGAPRLGWTDTVEPSRWQLLGAKSGNPACRPLVRAGQMVRVHGVRDDQGGILPYVDWVIGSTRYDALTDDLSIAPVGLVTRTLVDVLGEEAA